MSLRISILILGLLASWQAMGTQMVPLSIEDLGARADVIAHGTVQSISSRRLTEKTIYTCVELKVSSIWKGDSNLRTLTIAQAGGILGDQAQTIPGQARFEVGEEVVVFCVINHRGEGVVLGLTQGKFDVGGDDAIGKNCWNPFHGRPGGQTTPKAHWKPPLSMDLLRSKVTKQDR